MQQQFSSVKTVVHGFLQVTVDPVLAPVALRFDEDVRRARTCGYRSTSRRSDAPGWIERPPSTFCRPSFIWRRPSGCELQSRGKAAIGNALSASDAMRACNAR